MKIITLAVSILVTFAPMAAFAQENLVLPQVQVVPIKDTQFERDYELYIKLPKDYVKNAKAEYPVLYFTDALWHLEILSASTEYMLEEVILVGISWQKDSDAQLQADIGEHVSRFRDYSMRESDQPDLQSKYQLGQANNHARFLREEVIPYMDKHYRTDADSRTYFGYSLGGEFGAYILLTRPDTFDNYILGSPSIKGEVAYLAELNAALDSTTTMKDKSLNANVFITHGSLEQEMVAPIEEFMEILKNRRDPGLSLQKEVLEGNHQTAFPMTAVRSIAWLSTLIQHVPNSTTEGSFWNMPQLNKAFIDSAPEKRNDGIPVGELGVDGGNKALILKLANEIADKQHGGFDSFLIAHQGKLLFESYYARGRIDAPHPQASATKAYTSLALGRAIQMGYLTMADLDRPLVDFLDQLDATKFVKGAEKITLSKALTMRSGIRISEEQRKAMEQDTSRLQGQGQVQTLLELSAPITAASQTFKYQGDPDLVMQVLEAVVPGTAKDFIKTELLDKLGITDYEWETAPSGLPEAGWRTSMRSRDMVKWGTLVLNKGKWKSEQLVPEAYIDQALSRLLLTGDDDIYGGGKDVSKQGYGYYCWSADLKSGGTTYFATSAQGGGGQYIILVEALDLLVVVTAHDNDNRTLQLIAAHMIPAFVE